jgi:hypothetical protein
MSRFIDRDVTSRGPGRSVLAAADGLSGVYSGVLHTVPSGGTCAVIVPALSLTSYYTAICAPIFTGSVGDAVLVGFDEEKQPWVISASQSPSTITPLVGSDWTAISSFLNSWVNQGSTFQVAGYLKDPFGFVHLRGVVKNGTANTPAFQLPAGFRPGAEELCQIADGTTAGTSAYGAIDTGGFVTINYAAGQGSFLGLSEISFLAEN